MPFSYQRLEIVCQVLFLRWMNFYYCDTAAAAFSPSSLSAENRPGENGSIRAARLAGGDRFRQALAGDRARP